jgi:hypothetical protein
MASSRYDRHEADERFKLAQNRDDLSTAILPAVQQDAA